MRFRMSPKWGIVMKRKTTKDKILYIVKKDYEIAMKELMEYFSISEEAVRKQLNELLREGFVKKRVIKKSIGRPFHVYSLTEKGHGTFPNQYEELPVELLQDLETSQGKAAVSELLKTRQQREHNELYESIQQADSFFNKVQNLVDYQENKGYMIEMQQRLGGDIEIKNFNCPIYNLAINFTSVCTNEQEMYHDLFPDSKIISHSCMTSGGKYCGWTITRPDNEKAKDKLHL